MATQFRNLKAFIAWMHKKGWTESRFEDVKRPAFVRPKLDTRTDDQKRLILRAFDPKTFPGARNLAVVCVFLDTGVRLEELVHSEEKNVHLDRAYVEVFSRKTNDWRVIPLSSETNDVCRHYLEARERYLQLPVRHRAAPGDVNHRVRGRRRLAGHRSYEMTDNYFGLAETKLAAIKPKRSSLGGLSVYRRS